MVCVLGSLATGWVDTTIVTDKWHSSDAIPHKKNHFYSTRNKKKMHNAVLLNRTTMNNGGGIHLVVCPRFIYLALKFGHWWSLSPLVVIFQFVIFLIFDIQI